MAQFTSIRGAVISIAAGMVVTRVSDDRDVGQQVMGRMFRNGRALGIAAAIVALLGIIPGMPNLVFLLIASSMGWLAWKMLKTEKQVVETPVKVAPAVQEAMEASWSDVAPLDVLGLEVGYIA